MFHESSFSLESFGTDSWLFLLEVPYFDLSGKQRLYVRTVLESVYTATETDQIIATAAINAISVLDAAVSLRVNTEPLQIVVAAARQRKAPKPVAEKQVRQPKAQERTNKPAYVVAQRTTLTVSDRTESLLISTAMQQLVVSSGGQQLFVGKE